MKIKICLKIRLCLVFLMLVSIKLRKVAPKVLILSNLVTLSKSHIPCETQSINNRQAQDRFISDCILLV